MRTRSTQRLQRSGDGPGRTRSEPQFRIAVRIRILQRHRRERGLLRPSRRPERAQTLRPLQRERHLPVLAGRGRPLPYDPYKIYFDKDQPTDCGDEVAGNWGIIDFDGGSNSNSDTQSWVSNGYPGTISTPGWYQGDPGSFNPSLPLGDLLLQAFYVPVFDGWNELAGGNAEFHVIGFVHLELWGFQLTGPDSGRYLYVEFLTGIVQGDCCGSGIDTGLRIVRLCRFEGIESDCTP